MKTAAKAKSAQRKKPAAKIIRKKPVRAPRKAAPKLPRKKLAAGRKKAPVDNGLAFGEFEALRKQLDLSLEELSTRLGVSPTTMAARKASGCLTSDESGKVVSYARLLGHAMYLFGGLNEARAWLKTPQRGLHGAVPLDYAKTDFGAREVENLLTRLARERAQ